MKVSYCRKDFHKMGVVKLNGFSGLVLTGIYTNPAVFINPPVTAVEFKVARDEFMTAASTYQQYGPIFKTAFTEARDNLMKKLDSNSAYVDVLANGNTSLIAWSGFTSSREKLQTVESLDQIPFFLLTQSIGSKEVVVEIPTINNKGLINYSCICVKDAPLINPVLVNGQLETDSDSPRIHFDFNRSRRKVFKTLKEGSQYFFYVFAANSTSVSPLSNYRSMWAS